MKYILLRNFVIFILGYNEANLFWEINYPLAKMQGRVRKGKKVLRARNLTLREVLKKYLKASKTINRKLTRREGIRLYLDD